MPKDRAIVIAANCHNPNAFGDYNIAADIARSLAQELMNSDNSDIIIYLTSMPENMRQYIKLFGTIDKNAFIDLGNNTLVKLCSVDLLQEQNIETLAFIEANKCSPIDERYLKTFFSASTKISYVYGPHQDEFAPKSIYHSGILYEEAKKRPYISAVYGPYNLPVEPQADPFFAFLGIPQAQPRISASDHGIGYLGSMGFKDGLNNTRLGLSTIIEVSQLPVITNPKISEFITQVTSADEFSFSYFTNCGNFAAAAGQFMQTIKGSNLVMVGNYEQDLTPIIKKNLISMRVTFDSGKILKREDHRELSSTTINQISSLPKNVFAYLLNKSGRYIAVTGANTFLQALKAGKTPYVQGLNVNTGLFKSYLDSLDSVTKIDDGVSQIFKLSVIRLAALLSAPKPLSQVDLLAMTTLKKQSTISKLLGRYNKEVISRSECSIGAGLLLGGLLNPLSNNEQLARLNNAVKMMQKDTELAPPTYGQALRRACFYGNENVVGIILANAGTFNIDINEVTPKNACSPLHWAIEKNNLSVAELLINAGCNLKALDVNQETPMSYLIDLIKVEGFSKSMESCFKLLLTNGSEIPIHKIDVLNPTNYGLVNNCLESISSSSIAITVA